MKPYMLVEGSSRDIYAFESKVIQAMEEGYALAGDLVVHTNNNGDVLLLQSLLYDEFEDEEEFEEEDMEDGEEF